MTMQTEALPAESVAEVAPPIPPVTEALAAPLLGETAPAAPAVVTPASAPALVAEAPALPANIPTGFPPEVQEYVTRLEQQAQSAREQNERQILDRIVAQHAQELAQKAATAYGITPEQALPFVQEIAQQQGVLVYQQYQAEQVQRGKVRAAISIAKQFGVDPMQLLDLPSPQVMQQMAQTLSAGTKQSQEIAELRTQIAKLTKAAVPAQAFTQGAQPGAGAGLQGDALQSAWLKHERENPDRPNPYDNAYRAMVNS